MLHDSSFFGSRLVATQKSRLRLLDDFQGSISRQNFTAIGSSILYYSIMQQGGRRCKVHNNNNNNDNNGNLYSAHIHSKSAQSAVYKLSWNSNLLKQKYNTLYIIIIRMNGTFIIIIIIINHLFV